MWDGTKFPGGYPGKREYTVLVNIGCYLNINFEKVFELSRVRINEGLLYCLTTYDVQCAAKVLSQCLKINYL